VGWVIDDPPPENHNRAASGGEADDLSARGRAAGAVRSCRRAPPVERADGTSRAQGSVHLVRPAGTC